MTKRVYLSLRDRFFAKAVVPSDPDACWGWTARCTSKGYGQIGVGRRGDGLSYAHRVSWELHFGEIPKGKWVLHSCDHPICSNPRHLFLGCSQDNQSDMARKGRGRKSKLELPYGVSKNGKRFISQCSRLGTNTYLGTFDTPEEAHEVAMSFKRSVHRTHVP